MTAVVSRAAAAIIAAFRAQLREGRPWFDALLDAMAGWDLAGEVVDGREYRYLVGGEAFDWIVLADRLCNAVEDDALLPADEVDALLLEERPPQPMDEATFKARLGPAKYRAHLNFGYGVRVEEALQLVMEERIRKDRGSTVLSHDTRADYHDEIYQRIYGADRDALLHEFRETAGRPQLPRISLTELTEFTYWLFKKRVAVQDPARVASDTRLGLLMVQRLESLKQRRRSRPQASATTAAEPHIVDTVAVPSA